jgi:hypothetical protein
MDGYRQISQKEEGYKRLRSVLNEGIMSKLLFCSLVYQKNQNIF